MEQELKFRSYLKALTLFMTKILLRHNDNDNPVPLIALFTLESVFISFK